jgi:lipid II:glycine glycyltransferase (peptidoglycan interpeptide bridge formation enzyme)
VRLFNEVGFNKKLNSKIKRTIILDITSEMEIIRKNLNQKWRNLLNKAEKSGLTILEGTEDYLFTIFIKIYNEMLERKQFKEGINVNFFQKVQTASPEFLKMRVFICHKGDTPIAALVGSSIGDTGQYLLGASNDIGLKIPGAYLLQWRMIEWLKQNGCRRYDLGGIDPINGSGVYKFKSGFGGIEFDHMGIYEASEDFLSKLIYKVGSLISK